MNMNCSIGPRHRVLTAATAELARAVMPQCALLKITFWLKEKAAFNQLPPELEDM
jgi:hypothetical protein